MVASLLKLNKFKEFWLAEEYHQNISERKTI